MLRTIKVTCIASEDLTMRMVLLFITHLEGIKERIHFGKVSQALIKKKKIQGHNLLLQ